MTVVGSSPSSARARPRPFRHVLPKSNVAQVAPGMTLTAEIKVTDRTVLSYFVYPLVKAFDEGIREP